MHRHLVRRLPASLVAGGVLLFAATAATGASGTSITLNLHGGVNQQRTACRALHHYSAYHFGRVISMEGYVSPAPALPDGAWTVKIKIKQCKLGRFVTIAQKHVRGNGVLVNSVKEGHFRATYKPRVKGFFFARAYYYGYTPTLV